MKKKSNYYLKKKKKLRKKKKKKKRGRENTLFLDFICGFFIQFICNNF